MPLELDRIQGPDLGHLGAAGPAADWLTGMDRTGDRDQAASLFGYPGIQQIDLAGVELAPVGIEGHQAIVDVHLLPRGGELIENLFGFL